MKALVYTAPNELSFQSMPMPEPIDDEVLVRVEYVGICGSDMHAFLGHDDRRPAPLILGHEAAGVIVGGEAKGKRVTVNPLVTCRKCKACLSGQDNLCAKRQIISMPPREGAFAEYIKIPMRNLVNVPSDVPLEKAALCEPIACGWSAARKANEYYKANAYYGNDFQGASALVIGGGAIGVGSALCLQAQSAGEITLVEPNEIRRNFIRDKMGINAIDPDDLADDNYFDICIDGVGFEQTRAMASKLVRPGGVIVHIGLGSAVGGLDIRRMTLQDISFIGSYTYTQKDFKDTATAIFDGSLGVLDWTEIRSLEEGDQIFTEIKSGAVASPKIILKP